MQKIKSTRKSNETRQQHYMIVMHKIGENRAIVGTSQTLHPQVQE